MIRRILLNLAIALAVTWLALVGAAMTFAYVTNLAMPLQGVMDGE